jgi:predicted ATPase
LLPAPTAYVFGRDEAIGEVCQKLTDRFVSIVGPGGIGKTTVAVSVANRLQVDFSEAVYFLELGAVGAPRLVDQAIVATFGLPIQSSDPIADLILHLVGKRALLILDSCEHVLSEVAELANRLVREASDLYILTTTREALGSDGEYVLNLPPLNFPLDFRRFSASLATSFSAVQLFIQRAATGGAQVTLTDDDAYLVANMCRKLDGVPLAIELVAAQVSDHGLRETAALLDRNMALRWPGRRNGPKRHQTLGATLDWSYNLLSASERSVLRQLTVFAGGFTLDAARAVVAGPDVKADGLEAVAHLVAKSLVSANDSAAKRYRLLDSTRAYAALKLTSDVERQAIKRRHALYVVGWLREAAANARSVKRELSLMRTETDNVRAALEWAFSAAGDRSIAIELAVGSAPLWLGQALYTECQAWMLKASNLARQMADVSSRHRLSIQMALGSSEAYSGGLSKKTAGTWIRALKLADRVGDIEAQLTCLFIICSWEIRETWYGAALATAERRYKIAKDIGDPGAVSMCDWMVGHCQHHVGMLEDSRTRLQHLLDTDTEEGRLAQTSETGYDRKVDALGVLGNALWTLGFFEQARRLGKEATEEAVALGLATPFGVAWTWAGFTTYLSGVDTDELERNMAELIDHGRVHSLKHEEGFGQCMLGLCRIKQDDYALGAPMVIEGVRLLAEAHMLSFNPIILAHVAEAAADLGRISEAQALVERMVREDRTPEHWLTPELLRARAMIAIAAGDEPGGERLLSDALAMATRQGALAWRLKIVTSLARLRLSQGQLVDARRILEPVYKEITEGFETVDVRAAEKLLDELIIRLQ